jgi:hypothetical protein
VKLGIVGIRRIEYIYLGSGIRACQLVVVFFSTCTFTAAHRLSIMGSQALDKQENVMTIQRSKKSPKIRGSKRVGRVSISN